MCSARRRVDATPHTAVESAGDDISVPNPDLGEGKNHEWSTGKHEIAKMGASAPEDIGAFRHVKDMYALDGPVDFRESSRKSESQPFESLFDILSGMPQ